MGLDQLVRLTPRQCLHTDRARQRHQCQVEAVAVHEACPLGRRFTLPVDHIGLLAGAVQHRQAVRAPDKRKRTADRQGVEQLVGPNVLMDVDLHVLEGIPIVGGPAGRPAKTYTS